MQALKMMAHYNRGKLILITHRVERSKIKHSSSLAQTHRAFQRITLLLLYQNIVSEWWLWLI